MRNFFTLWRREMGACFLSAVAYVIMVVFLAMTGFVFMQMVEGHAGTREPLVGLLFKVIVFFWMPVLVTVITMRLFAEEKRSGTLETLLTAPVTETEVVLGKFAGACTFMLVVTVPAVADLFILAAISPGVTTLDMGALAGGALITALVSAFCMAIGLWISLLASNQIVAAICCFCGVMLPLLAGYAGTLLPPACEPLVAYVSTHFHVMDFARGSIDSRPVVLYVSGTALMLFMAVRQLESRRWRS